MVLRRSCRKQRKRSQRLTAYCQSVHPYKQAVFGLVHCFVHLGSPGPIGLIGQTETLPPSATEPATSKRNKHKKAAPTAAPVGVPAEHYPELFRRVLVGVVAALLTA